MTFYAGDPTCNGAPLTSVLVPMGLSSTTFYFVSNVSSSAVQISASATGLVGASAVYTVASEPTVANTTPLTQLTGEDFNLFEPQFDSKGRLDAGTLFAMPTNNPSLTSYGAWGTGAGWPVVLSDKIVFFFGDTKPFTPVPNQPYSFVEDKAWMAFDSVGSIPFHSIADLDSCNDIPILDGYAAHGLDPSYFLTQTTCPTLLFYRRADYKINTQDPIFYPTSIQLLSDLQIHQFGAYRTPAGELSLVQNGETYVYMFYNIDAQLFQNPYFPNKLFESIPLHGILAKSMQPVSAWSHADTGSGFANPPVFKQVTDTSSHALFDLDAGSSYFSDLPSDLNDPGKFIRVYPTVVNTDSLPNLPFTSAQSAQALLLFGTSWRFHDSNMFLAVAEAADIDQSTAVLSRDQQTIIGVSNWWYFAGLKPDGSPIWIQGDEQRAAPIVDSYTVTCSGPNNPANSTCVDSPQFSMYSVVWNQAIQQFIMLYSATSNSLRVANLPWGPWSTPVDVFDDTTSSWAPKLIRMPQKGVTTPLTIVPWIFNGTPQSMFLPGLVPPFTDITQQQYSLQTTYSEQQSSGHSFAPFLLDTQPALNNGALSYYFSMGTWEPYEVFLMHTTITPAPAPGP